LEKRVAHYDLKKVKELIVEKRYIVTLSARQSYTALGMSDDEVLDVIHGLTPRHLYKSMTSHHDHTMWHDVYHSRYKKWNLYIKLQISNHAIIISFKEL